MDSIDLANLQEKILAAKLARIAPLNIVEDDEANLATTFAVPITEPVDQFFGFEKFALVNIHFEGAVDTDAVIDDNPYQIIGRFKEGVFTGDSIRVTIKFRDLKQFRAAHSTAYNRIALHYKPQRIMHVGGGNFNMLAIIPVGVSLCTASYVPIRKYRKYSSLFDGPKSRTITAVWPDENGVGGNAQIIEGHRAIILKLHDNKPYEPDGGGDFLKLSGNTNVNFDQFLGRKIYPCRKGFPVDDAEPLGVIESVTLEHERVPSGDDPNIKIFIGHVKIKVGFLDTLPGQAEWAAIKAREPRGAVMGFKAWRLTRYSEGQNFVNDIFDWQVKSIGIENGTVMTAADIKAATAPPVEAEPPPAKPGLFQRATALLSGGAA